MGKHKPKELKDFGTNPFLNNFSIDAYRFENKIQLNDLEKAQFDDGTVVGLHGSKASLEHAILVEKDKSVTEYLTYNGEDLTKIIYSLDESAWRTFQFIKGKMRKNDLVVNIDFEEYKSSFNITSYTTFTKSRHRLCVAGIISPTPFSGWYWINPVFLFKGHRSTALKDYVNITGSGGKKK